MTEKVSIYGPIVEKLARTHFINVTVDVDDLRQELWKKIEEVLPRMEELQKDGVEWDDDGKRRWIKLVLNNYIKDIKMSESKIPGSSQYALLGDMNALLGEEMNNVFEKMTEINQEDLYEAKELLNIILEWADGQSDLVKKFIHERINPSDEIEYKWQERLLSKKSPRGKNATNIPIWSLMDMIGMKQKEYYTCVGHNLREYIKERGYAV